MRLAHASDGNEMIGIGAIQQGAAGAGIASPQDATWALLNPAAMVDLERRVDVGVDIILMRRTVKPDGPIYLLNLQLPQEDLIISLANPDAGHMADSSPFHSGSFGLVWPLKRLTLGFGVFGVQGNKVSYPRPRSLPGLEGDGKDRRAQLEVVKIPFSVAHRLENGWAVGGAVVGLFSRLRTDSLTLELVPTRGDYEWDESYGFGFKLALYKRWDKWSFGAAYTTRQWTTEFDKYDDLLKFHLDQPQQFQIGLAYRPIPKLELLLDYKFIDWSGISQISKDTIRGGLSWDDQHIIKAGVSYELTKRFTIRGGVSYGEAPVPGDSVFSNSLFPAISEAHVALGLSYAFKRRHEVHFAYVHALKNEMTETGTGDLFSVGGRGSKFTLEQDVFSLQYSLKF